MSSAPPDRQSVLSEEARVSVDDLVECLLDATCRAREYDLQKKISLTSD